MTNLDSFKDIRTIASISALVAVGVSFSYFSNEISKIKEEQEEIKKHLASIVPHATPEVAKSLNHTIESIKILNSRMAKAQEDIRILSENNIGLNGSQPAKRVYKRLTQPGSHDLVDEIKPKFNTRSTASVQFAIPEKDDIDCDDDDDAKAMM